MNKQEISGLLNHKYTSFTDYMRTLPAEACLRSKNQKWTAAQHLEHIVLCVKPLVRVFSMDKTAIAETFGKPDGAGRNYDVLKRDYLEKLKEGGKAPGRFVPDTVQPEQKEILCGTLDTLIADLCTHIRLFTEEELDTLSIPHPLLGNLSLREMLYNAAYHVEHHHEQAIQTLNADNQHV